MNIIEACINSNEDEVQRLLAQGHNPNEVGDNLATPLLIACKKGDANIVQLLLANATTNVNHADIKNGATPLLIACKKRHYSIIKLLLAHDKVDVNLADMDGYTPLLYECQYGQGSIAKLLLAHDRIDVNRGNKDGIKPLLVACLFAPQSTIKLLLAHDEIDVNETAKGRCTPLIKACHLGYDSIVKLFLAHDEIDVNQPIWSGVTPLFVACQEGHVSVVKSLLSHGEIDVNQVDENVITPLSIACSKGFYSIVELLLAHHNIDVNQVSHNGLTPLMMSCQRGYESIVKLLLTHDEVDVNQANEVGTTPLYIACKKGYDPIIKLLLANDDIDVNQATSDGFTPLYALCSIGYDSAAKLLLGFDKVDVNHADKNGVSALHDACREGRRSIVELLLAHDKIDINQADKNGASPLHNACRRGHHSIVELFLTHEKVDTTRVDKNGATPLLYACTHGHDAIVKLFLAKDGITVNQGNESETTPLIIACENGNKSIVKLLLSHDGIDVNHANKVGATALHLVCANGHESIVKLLLSHDEIDVNRVDEKGATPLHFVCGQAHDSIAKQLLAHDKIDVNCANEVGATPLLTACYLKHNSIVKLLIVHKEIDVNLGDKNGLTPLMKSCADGYEPIVKLLLTHDEIDVNQLNEIGINPLMAACSKEQYQTVVLLLAHDKIDVNFACQHGNDSIVRLLFDHDESHVNTNIKVSGYTPLHFACHLGYVSIVKLLLAHDDINVNQVTLAGESPFLLACEREHSNIVQLLSAHDNVDINLARKDGATPLFVVCSSGCREIVESLLNNDKIAVCLSHTVSNKTLIEVALRKFCKALIELLISKTLSNSKHKKIDQDFNTCIDLFCIGKLDVKTIQKYWLILPKNTQERYDLLDIIKQGFKSLNKKEALFFKDAIQFIDTIEKFSKNPINLLVLKLKIHESYLKNLEQTNIVDTLFQLILKQDPQTFIKSNIFNLRQLLTSSLSLFKEASDKAKFEILKSGITHLLASKSESDIKMGCVLATAGRWKYKKEYDTKKLVQKGCAHYEKNCETLKRFSAQAVVLNNNGKLFSITISNSLKESLKQVLASEGHPNLDTFINSRLGDTFEFTSALGKIQSKKIVLWYELIGIIDRIWKYLSTHDKKIIQNALVESQLAKLFNFDTKINPRDLLSHMPSKHEFFREVMCLMQKDDMPIIKSYNPKFLSNLFKIFEINQLKRSFCIFRDKARVQPLQQKVKAGLREKCYSMIANELDIIEAYNQNPSDTICTLQNYLTELLIILSLPHEQLQNLDLEKYLNQGVIIANEIAKDDEIQFPLFQGFVEDHLQDFIKELQLGSTVKRNLQAACEEGESKKKPDIFVKSVDVNLGLYLKEHIDEREKSLVSAGANFIRKLQEYAFYNRNHSSNKYLADRIIHGMCVSKLVLVKRYKDLILMLTQEPSLTDYRDSINLLIDWIRALSQDETVEDKTLLSLGFMLLDNFRDYNKKCGIEYERSESNKVIAMLRRGVAHALDISDKVSSPMIHEDGMVDFNRHGCFYLKQHLRNISEEISLFIGPQGKLMAYKM